MTQRPVASHRRPPAAQRPVALALFTILGSLLGSSVLAQDSSHYYVGFGGGQTRGSFDAQRIGDSVVTAPIGGFASQTLSSDRSGTGYKVFGGYQMNSWLGLELGYFNLGKQRFGSTTVPAGTLAGQLRSQGVSLDLVGTLPLAGNWSALARAGVAHARTRGVFSGTGAVVVADPTPSDRSTNLKLGVGLQYAFNESVLLRGEAERYRNSDAVGGRGHVNLFSASLVFPFGHAPKSTRRVAYVAPAPAPLPMPVAAAPTPMPLPAAAPLVAAAPPAPVPVQRVRYSAESLFGFGASALQPAGRSALDGFSAELAGARYDQVTVEGHTDRLGSTAFNQALSQQRADAVKAYLVTQGKLDPAKVQAVGMGEGTPVTQAGTCQGQRQSPALIACLQPDRRVEIAVSGSR